MKRKAYSKISVYTDLLKSIFILTLKKCNIFLTICFLLSIRRTFLICSLTGQHTDPSIAPVSLLH